MPDIASLQEQEPGRSGHSARHDAWSAGQSYERYMGRWSRDVAGRFLDWLAAPVRADWLDIGCGTGALSRAILSGCDPNSLIGIDPSEGFVAHAAEASKDSRARFEVAGAESVPLPENSVDIAASGLVLNFVPDRVAALREMTRVVRPGGRIAFYVWDYPGGGVGFIDAFWKAAAELDDQASELDEKHRFAFCTPDKLSDLCREAGLDRIEVEAIGIPTRFPTFDDLWHPFTLGAGPAPGYAAKLDAGARQALKDRLRRNVGLREPVEMKARAWAVKAVSSS